MELTARPYTLDDLELIVDYFLNSSEEYLRGMGVLVDKLPSKAEWITLLKRDIVKPHPDKAFFYLIWEIDGVATGHCNINNLKYGESAYMHLHLWKSVLRKKGIGAELVKLSLPHFFETFQLQRLYCEPYSQNPAPNATLPKAGFVYEKTHTPPPGWINFPMEVNRWTITREQYLANKEQ